MNDAQTFGSDLPADGERRELATYDSYTHRDGRVCILLEDGTWFVPLDAGGEGYECEREHGVLRESLIDFAAWFSEQAELDVMTPDEVVDEYLSTRSTREGKT